jgi:hypothetical protein
MHPMQTPPQCSGIELGDIRDERHAAFAALKGKRAGPTSSKEATGKAGHDSEPALLATGDFMGVKEVVVEGEVCISRGCEG